MAKDSAERDADAQEQAGIEAGMNPPDAEEGGDSAGGDHGFQISAEMEGIERRRHGGGEERAAMAPRIGIQSWRRRKPKEAVGMRSCAG